MGTFSTLFVLASAAASAGNATPQTVAETYNAVLYAQYVAHSAPVAQRPEEAKRVYDAYLNSIGEKSKSRSDNSSGGAGEPSH